MTFDSTRHLLACLLIIGLAPLALSCADDEGVGTFSSSIDDSRETGELSDEEEERLCDEFREYNKREGSAEYFCRIDALADAHWNGRDAEEVRDICNDSYDECLEDDDQKFLCCLQAPDDCSVTVGELEECIEAEAETMRNFRDSVPECDELTRETREQFLQEEIIDGPWTTKLSEECHRIEEECPGYLIHTEENY